MSRRNKKNRYKHIIQKAQLAQPVAVQPQSEPVLTIEVQPEQPSLDIEVQPEADADVELNIDETVVKTRRGKKPVMALAEEVYEITESDEEIVERIRYRFSVLDDMTRAVKRGHIRSLIVSGPPGVGKSFGVERVLGKHQLMADLAGDQTLKKYDIVKGSMTALGLFSKLFEYSKPGSILVFDDCDSIFGDEVSLNLLKAALDSSKTRRLNWLADSRMLRSEGIPNSFDFHGGVVFITNMNFDLVRSPKLRPHLEALESRSLYLDLTIHTEYEKILRIKQIIGDGMLDEFDFEQETKDDIIDYITDNREKMRELSLRTVLKTAGLAKSFPDRWKDIANMTIMKKQHSFGKKVVDKHI